LVIFFFVVTRTSRYGIDLSVRNVRKGGRISGGKPGPESGRDTDATRMPQNGSGPGAETGHGGRAAGAGVRSYRRGTSRASISWISRGIDADRLRQPVLVTSRSSSIRTPIHSE